MRDTQRQKVYNAEEVLKPLCTDLPTTDEIKSFATRLLARKRLRNDLWAIANRAYKIHPSQEDLLFRVPLVKDGRGRRRASGNSVAIKMPKWCRNDWITCHELAHSIASRLWGRGIAAHGREFCGAYLMLVKHGMGMEAYQTLRRSFAKANLSFLT